MGICGTLAITRWSWAFGVLLVGVPVAAEEAVADSELMFEANGLDETGEFDCSKGTHSREMGDSFEVSATWELSFKFVAPRFEAGWHQLVCWGDDRPGRDPLYVRLDGNKLEAAVGDAHANTMQRIVLFLEAGATRKPVSVRFRYTPGQLDLWGNDVHRTLKCDVVPALDRPMPLLIGGANATTQRFTGTVSSLRLANISDASLPE